MHDKNGIAGLGLIEDQSHVTLSGGAEALGIDVAEDG